MGNPSARTDCTTCIPPKNGADTPGDTGGDGIPDLLAIDTGGALWTHPGQPGGELDTGAMYLRRGKPGAVSGSVDLDSLMPASNAVNGDELFGSSWTETNTNAVIGIPDINNDGIPDIWARFASDGRVAVYHPSATDTNGPVKTVIGSGWNDKLAFG